MSHEWGRNQYAGEWPNPKPAWAMATLLLAVLTVTAICAYRYAYVLTPLQKFYLTTYIRSGLRAEIGFKTGRYALLDVVGKKGSRLALNEEVMPVTTATRENTFALTEAAVKQGDRQLVWRQGQYDNAELHAFLGHWIYRDQTLFDFLRPALFGGLGVFIVSLLMAIPKGRGATQFRMDASTPEGDQSWIADGLSGTLTTIDGKTHSLPPYNLKNAGSLTLPVLRIAKMLNDSTTAIRYMGGVTENGRSTYRVRLIPAVENGLAVISGLHDPGAIDLFIDSATYRLLSEAEIFHDDKNVKQNYTYELDFSQYQAVNGVLVPFEVAEKVSAQSTWLITLSNINFNVGLSDADFATSSQ